jgi:hypothetical protein
VQLRKKPEPEHDTGDRDRRGDKKAEDAVSGKNASACAITDRQREPDAGGRRHNAEQHRGHSGPRSPRSLGLLSGYLGGQKLEHVRKKTA